MKNLVCGLILLFIGFSVSAQDNAGYLIRANYCENDTCEAVVIAQSGLRMRLKPDFAAKVLTVIPFAKKVRYRSPDPSAAPQNWQYDVDSIPGRWLKVMWKGKTGYVFSGYLGNGIFRMNKPFYLLAEAAAYCWDDAYISSAYHYYGVFPNADTSSLTVKACQPLFFNRDDGGMGGVTFTLKQKQPAWFAFAAKDSFPQGNIPVIAGKQMLLSKMYQKIDLPQTDWEITLHYIIEKDPAYPVRRLIIRDKKTGVWHRLFDDDTYVGQVRLEWCGDLDGDRAPDFMISFSSHHSEGMALFLSKNAGVRKFVKLAGIYFWGDCC